MCYFWRIKETNKEKKLSILQKTCVRISPMEFHLHIEGIPNESNSNIIICLQLKIQQSPFSENHYGKNRQY